ncbi:hypothetical protein SAMN06295967_10270 [Belliella buryatensis]|uniref:Uncharacterized protein n=1 Tax=Belliella buryatensis TaxID=1500549 RepID=A0A239B3M6_9BACT|nr:hypothetical protein SAMN06295967_10270 [Belliella buryatensis]
MIFIDSKSLTTNKAVYKKERKKQIFSLKYFE